MDRSYLYGDGLFETVRVEGGRAHRLGRHIDRFRRSATELGYREETVASGVAALESLRDADDGLWRVTVTRDPEGAPFGGTSELTVARRDIGDRQRPRLTVLKGWYWPDDPLGHHKTTSYLRWVEARRRAQALGFDDAVMVSNDGLVGETSVANVMALIDGVLVTPPARGLLPGVTRGAVIDGADALGLEIVERPLRLEELTEAREIICTSSGVLGVAAASLDGEALEVVHAPTIARYLAEEGVDA